MKSRILGRDRPLVLIADDDFAMRLLMCESIEQSGFDVVEADDGASAVAVFEQRQPDLVVLDVEMPKLNGFEVCRRIRSFDTDGNVPVVMVTALDDIESVNHAYNVAATDFITKPINWTILGHRIRYMLRASHAFRELSASEERNRALLSAMPDWMYQLDREGTCIDLQANKSTGPHPRATEIIGKKLHEFLPLAVAGKALAKLRRALETGDIQTLDFCVDHHDTQRHFEARLVVSGADEVLAITRDVTERKEAQSAVHRLAYYDSLTGLPNRQLFLSHLASAIRESDRTDAQCGVLFIDLDRFNRINETFGHSTGDKLIQSVASALRQSLRGTDYVARVRQDLDAEPLARLGGDEFTVLLPGIEDVEHLVSVARRILDALSRPQRLDVHEVIVTGSIGIAVYPRDGDDVDALLKNADTAMYCAKERGRNNYQFYDTSMNAQAYERLSLENNLRKALDRSELLLHYQPQVDIRTQKVVGFEALVRWMHPDCGMIPPGRFIPVAEETGLIGRLGEWVLREACRQNRAWQNEGMQPIRVAVNLSSEQFRRGRLVETVASALGETGLDPMYLELEITESVLMQHTRETVKILEALRNMGIRLAVDDFGTGYSSLAYLKRFPIDSLKIDRSFVCDIGTEADERPLASAIVALGHSLNLDVIAEGVEEPPQLEFLAQHGCDQFQGFIFSRPVPADKVPAIIDDVAAFWRRINWSQPAAESTQPHPLSQWVMGSP